MTESHVTAAEIQLNFVECPHLPDTDVKWISTGEVKGREKELFKLVGKFGSRSILCICVERRKAG